MLLDATQLRDVYCTPHTVNRLIANRNAARAEELIRRHAPQRRVRCDGIRSAKLPTHQQSLADAKRLNNQTMTNRSSSPELLQAQRTGGGELPRRMRLTIHAALALSLMAAISGLIGLALDQSTQAPDPVIRGVPLPTEPNAATLIDLNRATAAELQALPGIGPSRTEAILRARAVRPFRSLGDLVERDLLRVGEAIELRAVATVYRTVPSE